MEEEKKRYFKVCAKFGHVGRNRYVLKTVPISAVNKKEAAEIARNLARVKHHHKDAIRSVTEIDFFTYSMLIILKELDPFFSCKNVQESRQKEILKNLEILKETSFAKVKKSELTNKLLYQGKEKIRNPKKYVRFYPEKTYKDYPEYY